jgi:hypothetical protein
MRGLNLFLLATIWLIIILIATIFISAKSEVANQILKKIMFSNKSYAKHIEVKTYILNDKQLADLFTNLDKSPIQLPVDNYRIGSNQYFLIRVKNLSNRHAWGTLSCKVRCIHRPFKIPILSINDHFCDTIICVSGTVIAKAKNSEFPDMSYEWDELYTK